MEYGILWYLPNVDDVFTPAAGVELPSPSSYQIDKGDQVLLSGQHINHLVGNKRPGQYDQRQRLESPIPLVTPYLPVVVQDIHHVKFILPCLSARLVSGMKKIIAALCILFLAGVTSYAQSKGTIVTETIRSVVLADNKIGLDPNREVKVYLPPSYNATSKRYPVVYFCHNMFWGPDQIIADGRPIGLLDRAMSTRASKEFIVVFANLRGPGFGCLYENSTTTGRWLDYITQELVPFVDQKFRTIPNKNSRAVTGDFFGGRGSLKLAMTYPNLFGSVYAMHPVATGNGSIPWTASNVNWEKISNAKTYNDLAGPDRTAIFVAIHQAFLPNPNRPPFYCDFSVEIVDGVRKASPENMIKAKKAFLLDETLRESAANLRQLNGIAIDWGRYDDTYAHIESNRAFSGMMEDLGIVHTAEEYNGTTSNKLWTDDGRFYTRVLPFMNKHLTFE